MSAKRAGPVGGETSQTLDRGLAILQLLADREHGAGMTVTELASALGVGRPVVYRLVATLEARDFVTRREDGRIRLGLGLTRMSASVLPLLRDASLPTLRALADAVGATAHLTIVEGGDAFALSVVEPTWTDYHVAYRIGSRHALDHGAAGKAILGARVGRTSYVVTDGELQSGAHGVAAPIVGLAGLEASVGVVSMGPLDEQKLGPQVVSAAARIARALR
ncbi:IclR family transcriptional regulator [Segeticoccus rhizosphaerae]|uniref:IclR family transcriptional regulator n=1 Tax=Segeticoccus rhizosphaerae TaxID=1104777 RepID=UPI0010C0353F|nr:MULTISPECIES: helix-turn-helix domain-containing protein [Intrasporangiaceae]